MRRLWVVSMLGGMLIADRAGAQPGVRPPDPGIEQWRRDNQVQGQDPQEQERQQQQQARWWRQWQEQYDQRMRDVDDSYRRLREQRELQDLHQRVLELDQRRAY